MLSNKRFLKRKCAMLLAVIILLNPIHSMAEEVNGQLGTKMQKNVDGAKGSHDALDIGVDTRTRCVCR